jgi:dTDP-L-rhamnose 4-epimerase
MSRASRSPLTNMHGTRLSVLITGGAGFIGSRLSKALHARGHRVRVLDSLSPQIHGADPLQSTLYQAIAGKCEFRHGDVTCRDDLESALIGVDTVIHLAAETGTGQSMYAIQHYTNVNIGGTALLLDLIANGRFPVKRLVVASSRAVAGEGKYHCLKHGVHWPDTRSCADMAAGRFEPRCPMCGTDLEMLPTDEDSDLRPSSVYGVTKLTQEQMVLAVGKALGISAIAYRYQNVYGPGQSLSNPYTGILSIFSTRVRNGSPISIFEDGRESRDFVYIDDVVAATILGIEFSEPITQVFNVGSGVATDVLTVAHTLRQLLGGSSEISVSGQYRVGDIRHNVADLSRISRVLGYRPSVPFAEGLDRFVAWVRDQPIPQDRYEASLEELHAKGLFK